MALNGCEDAYLWTRNPRKTGVFQGIFPSATLLWSWVSGVRIPSLTPSKSQVKGLASHGGWAFYRSAVRFGSGMGADLGRRLPEIGQSCAGVAGVMVGLVALSHHSAAPAHWRFR
jgi:hypothetical protein